MIAVLFTVLFAISGALISEIVFRKHKFSNRLWLGLAIGLLMLTWLPSLFALLVGFTITAQVLSAAVALIGAVGCAIMLFFRRKKGKDVSHRIGRDWTVLFLAIPILMLCLALLNTHILHRAVDGSIWVGQVTYGDLAMHLGFITSIAEQTTFPPQYSIFPGHALNYPFLCETSGASLYQLGASIRQAYIISAFYAFILVVFGVYMFFEQWLKRRSRAIFATILFFFGSGFGFFYFFDLSKSGGLLSSLVQMRGQTVSQALLDGFYQTPTNMPSLGLRWVNPIVDMMIPQRATLFGWAFLFPCLYLLHGLTFERKHENVIPLAVIAGLLPMIHTHSFLTLGVISTVYCVIDLIVVRFEKKRLLSWILYAGVTCLIAAPQLFLFTFRQASESGLVRFHLNWANEADSYLWFYTKNLGLIFLLAPFAFLILPKRDKKIYAGAILLFIIAELIEFQPNNYDNNKLLFVWFAFTCGMVSKLVFVISHRAAHAVRRKSSASDRARTHRICIAAITGMILLYGLYKLAFDANNGMSMRPGTALTLFFSAGILLALCIGAIWHARSNRTKYIRMIPPLTLSVWMLVSLFVIWLDEYRSQTFPLKKLYVIWTVLLCLLTLILFVWGRVSDLAADNKKRERFVGASAALTIGSYLLIFIMTVSSVMTIVRECKSSYQVYTKSEAELSDQIKEMTEPDDVILANSYHWNLVTPLTGRSIVTGTGTFLYYHGIDPTEREADVTLMYEDPSNHPELFERYHIKHVLISNAERGTYDIDYAFFNTHAEIVCSNDSGLLYRLNP
ncbi:MAG: hypothetical protein IKZ44_07765 [Clostridia bacterium]|nr:hypothetical protein [Clostridia bacterium]